jgi:integrase
MIPIVDLIGKRNKVRSVPMAGWIKALLDRWTGAAGITAGPVFVEMGPGRSDTLADATERAGEHTTEQAIMRVVVKHAVAIGRPELRPHDLRRTFGKLARAGGVALEQISLTYGHDSITTTQRYLGTELDFVNSASDAIRLNVRMRSAPAAFPLP